MKLSPLLILIFCFLSLDVYPKQTNINDSLKLVIEKNKELNKNISSLRDEIEYTKSLVQVGNGTISNQLSSSQHNLNTLNILLILVTIGLTLIIPFASRYFAKLSKQVSNNLIRVDSILKKTDETFQKVNIAEKNVEEIQSTIMKNLSALYQSLEGEEIKTIFDRLKLEPLNLIHFFPKLATVRLPKESFDDLVDIYKKLKVLDFAMMQSCLILLCCQFPSQTFKNEDLVKELQNTFVTHGFYPTELSNYLIELKKYIADKPFEENLYLVTNTIRATAQSLFPTQIINTVLTFFNENLSNEQKILLISSLNIPNVNVRPLPNNWQEILKVV